MKWGIWVVLMLGIAGCLGDGDTDDGSQEEVAEAPAPPVPSVFRIADNPNHQREAVLTVSADGATVLSCMHGNFETPITALVSQNGGLDWTSLTFPDAALPAGDCETAILPDGTWAFAASSQQGATVYFTEDQGATWTWDDMVAVAPFVPGISYGLVDRPWIHAVGDELWFSYMPTKDTPGPVVFRKTADHGATWSDPVIVAAPDPGKTNVRQGHMVIEDGKVSIPVMRYEASRSDTAVTGAIFLQIAATTDGGSTWTLETVLESDRVVRDWPSLASTPSGHRVLMSTYETDNGTRGIAVLVAGPDGAWSDPIVVHDPGGEDATWPWIDAGTGSNTTFLFHGGALNGTKRVWMGTLDAATLDIRMWPVGEGLLEVGSVDHDGDGNAFAAWTVSDDAQYFARLAAPLS